ncbi:phosphoesterase family-domain-containing protein [Roridomyces roridus]|uniref:Phosphoesterase family-domain-containing protein n=1 Tax=Roridomyces roridus TaxID=1738132 RepID=A0AAD7FSA6_9AGAR|nr:phosphoesterase family-domain-containing protein [Roridomyces roridus]
MVNTTAVLLGLLATTTNVVDTLFGNTTSPAAAASPAAVASTISPPPFGYKAGSKESVANMKDKIKRVVWILLENRSFDNILGGVKRPGLDNPANRGDVCNPANLSAVVGPPLCTRSKDFDSIANDPNHSVTGNNLEFYGQFAPDNEAIQSGKLVATNQGFVEEQLLSFPGITAEVAAEEVMGYYSEAEVPTMVEIVDDFLTFNYWFSCIPGPTNPNRACALSGTSAGHGKNDDTFDVAGLNITSIFQAASEHDISWLNYDGTNGAFAPDALFYSWTEENAKNNIVPIENFFQDAYLGLLPQLSYLNPSCCGLNSNSMHPTGNVSFGQIFIKQVYDALRQGPQWSETLLILTYDESGGFHDHVPSPLAVRPDNLTYTEPVPHSPDNQTYTFEFDRLGGRMPTFLISPYVPKGHIEDFGTDPETGKAEAYSATSVLKTLGLLWDIEDFTPRVSHSPTFDHLIGPKMRGDAPQFFSVPKPFPNDV